MHLDTSVIQLSRVGDMLAKRLKYLRIETVAHLIHYFPFRYEDYRAVLPIKEVEDGVQTTVHGKIEHLVNKRSPRKRMMITEAVVADDTGRVRVVWFGQPFLIKTLKVGDTVFLSGKAVGDMFGVSLVSPQYEKDTNHGTTHTARLVPMYSLTAGITQKQFRFLVVQALDAIKEVEEWLTEDIRTRARVISLHNALRSIHFPTTLEELKAAERRLKFDELFVLQLRGEMIRQSLRQLESPIISFPETEIKQFVAGLPFQLTRDQKVAAWEIFKDIASKKPMNRLLEGDVGSGKTVVATMALYAAALAGYQGVIMAPTEILAKQHFESLAKLFARLPLTIALFTRSQRLLSDSEKREDGTVTKKVLLEKVHDGTIHLVIGTHALLTETVVFKKLGLVIVDEQHRFGVHQRKTIREKSEDGLVPHFLSMTATPIPRSFALTVYGDLDISIIRELPPGRKPIKTRVVAPHQRDRAYQFIREQVKNGRQVFVICPLIAPIGEESIGRADERKTVMTEYKKLSENVFPDLRIGYVHGKMKATEKDEAMHQFANNQVNILVATSVVEVGVNIPNASVMMIEGAERFGLAQLHQFRGRVGRSVHQSYCFLFAETDTQTVQERLAFFEKTTDGFLLAEYDLEKRGPGDVYGTAQSGMMQLKLATMRDIELIKIARESARDIDFDSYPALVQKVKAWEESVHLE